MTFQRWEDGPVANLAIWDAVSRVHRDFYVHQTVDNSKPSRIADCGDAHRLRRQLRKTFHILGTLCSFQTAFVPSQGTSGVESAEMQSISLQPLSRLLVSSVRVRNYRQICPFSRAFFRSANWWLLGKSTRKTSSNVHKSRRGEIWIYFEIWNFGFRKIWTEDQKPYNAGTLVVRRRKYCWLTLSKIIKSRESRSHQMTVSQMAATHNSSSVPWALRERRQRWRQCRLKLLSHSFSFAFFRTMPLSLDLVMPRFQWWQQANRLTIFKRSCRT